MEIDRGSAPNPARSRPDPKVTLGWVAFAVTAVAGIAVISFLGASMASGYDTREDDYARVLADKNALVKELAAERLKSTGLQGQVAQLSATLGASQSNVAREQELNAARRCNTTLPRHTFPARVPDVFNPFSEDELNTIAAFVRQELSLDEEEPEDMLGDWLYALDFMPANKSDVLAFLDGTGAQQSPGRYARAIVYHLKGPSRSMREYVVGPFSNNVQASTTSGAKVQLDDTFNIVYRPVSDAEYGLMEEGVVAPAMEVLAPLMQVTYGETYDDGHLSWTDSAPRGYNASTRQTLIWFLWNSEGMYALPIGLTMLIDHKGLDSSDWGVLQVVYNGQAFDTPQQLMAAFTSHQLKLAHYPRPDVGTQEAPLWSSLRRRGAVRDLDGVGHFQPTTVTHGEKRYSINPDNNRQVYWMGWDIHLGFSMISGIYFNDVRFLGQRIMYELSLQDAYASYSGAQALQSMSMYSDAGWAMGVSGFPLVLGVDCPSHAAFLDFSYFHGGASSTLTRSVCVWEQPEHIGLMRHYDQNHDGDDTQKPFTFVAGYPRTVLVVRTTATVYNYDYYYSYIFHLEGSMQVSVMATGYLQSEFYPANNTDAIAAEERFSTRINEHSMGSLHDHLFGFKVDLDVLGHENDAMRMDYRVVDFTPPFKFGTNTPPSKFKAALMKHIKEEDNHEEFGRTDTRNSTYRITASAPSMFMVGNHQAPNGKNAWGSTRSYMLYTPGSALQLLGDDVEWMKAQQWTKYTVAITKRKDEEPRSCRPLYDMQAPGEPTLEFDKFLNGENLEHEDVVAWVTIGALHMPTAEDSPITTTPGTEVTFFIRPYNYFNESAAVSVSKYFFETGERVDDRNSELTERPDAPFAKRCWDPTPVMQY